MVGEFHYFRLPGPELWRDVLEKIRAAGFSGVSPYFHWGYHSPAPGSYDFTGVRDVDRLLRPADELGLYVVARPRAVHQRRDQRRSAVPGPPTANAAR